MCKVIEDMIMEERREVAMRMIGLGKLTIDEIAACSNLTVAEVEALAEKYSA